MYYTYNEILFSNMKRRHIREIPSEIHYQYKDKENYVENVDNQMTKVSDNIYKLRHIYIMYCIFYFIYIYIIENRELM